MGKDSMSALMETLAENEAYSSPTSGATTSDVLSSEQIFGLPVLRPRDPLRIRLQVPSPHRILIQTLVKLVALTNLPAGWDSYGAKPIRQRIIDAAVRWIPSLLQPSMPAPAVVPQVNGGVQLEWHRKGIDLEIYFDSPDSVHFAAEDRASGEAVEGSLPGAEETLRQWVARISD
jgi:hypothetical protein